MPAKFSLSYSTCRNLARSRCDNSPTSPVFSQLESGDGVNLPYTLSRTLAEFDRIVRHRILRRQKAKPLDSNLQHTSLPITAKSCRVPSLNRLAAFPQNPGTSEIHGVMRVHSRIRFHVARVPRTFNRLHQHFDAATIENCTHFCTPLTLSVSTGRKPPASRDMHHRRLELPPKHETRCLVIS